MHSQSDERNPDFGKIRFPNSLNLRIFSILSVAPKSYGILTMTFQDNLYS
jgi:hypothetical protein